MEDPIDVGGVANVADLHAQSKILFSAVKFKGEGRTVGKMVNNGFDCGKINGRKKNNFIQYAFFRMQTLKENMRRTLRYTGFLRKLQAITAFLCVERLEKCDFSFKVAAWKKLYRGQG